MAALEHSTKPDIKQHWPVDTPSWVEASAHDSEVQGQRLRIVTYNVWFDPMANVERFDALIALALARDADVICLQEVTRMFKSAVEASRLLNAKYSMSKNTIGSYGCMILAKHELGATFSEVKMDSRMGRSLLVASFAPRRESSAFAWCEGAAVATVHLESLNFPHIRDKQLRTANKTLSHFRNCVLCGDFNFDDTQEYGDWRVGRTRDPSTLENTVLARRIPEFVDTWAALRPSEPGKTFDGETNPICVHDKKEQMRYDRMMLKSARVATEVAHDTGDNADSGAGGTGGSGGSRGGVPGGGLVSLWRRVVGGASPPAAWTATDIDMIGTEPINEQNLKPSDHYGLVLEIAPAT